MAMSQPAWEGPEQQRLGSLVRRCRARISRDCPSLGPYLRFPARIGKPVTQEELAELVGITRQWYALLESDRPIRVSACILGRIADALMMDRVERATLFRLAVPELRAASPRDLLDALGSLRRLTRRLLAATTESEALTLVREHAMTRFAPDQMVTFKRVEEGWWDRATTGGPDEDDCGGRFFALLRQRWGPALVDDLHGYTFLTQPGELMTRSEIDASFPDLAAKAHGALDAFGRASISFAMASIRSTGGSVARIMALHTAAHAFSEVERAELSALADLTSLALSS